MLNNYTKKTLIIATKTKMALMERSHSSTGARSSILSVIDNYQSGPLQSTTALYRLAFLGAAGVGKSTLAS